MADPLSVTASALAVLTAFLQCSRGLHNVVSTVKGAPEEVVAVVRDTAAFQAVVLSLQHVLQRRNVVTIVNTDCTLKHTIDIVVESLGSSVQAMRRLEKALGNLSESSVATNRMGRSFVLCHKPSIVGLRTLRTHVSHRSESYLVFQERRAHGARKRSGGHQTHPQHLLGWHEPVSATTYVPKQG